MPTPAVYVIAVVGTVGVAIAFKEFIYPRIAPRIDQWKAEFQAAKKRRSEAERSAAMAGVALIQRSPDGGEDTDGDSDHSDVGLGKETPTLQAPGHTHMRNGLLIRRRSCRFETLQSKPGDVELDWITGTSTATETDSQQSDLRQRKNTGSLNESVQQLPLSSTASTGQTPPSIRSGSQNSSQMNSSHKSIEPPFLDESIQAIPYTPLVPARTSTPTHVLCNSSSSPLDSPSPEDALLSKWKTDVTNNVSILTHPLLTSFQPPSSSSRCAADMANGPLSKAESFPPSPAPDYTDPDVAVAGTMIPDTSLPPLSSPPALALSSPPELLLLSQPLRPSPYQTPPHVFAIPSLSQSYPLDDLLDYENGLELLSPPSPLSRTNSPFEFAGLSPRPGIAERSTLLLARSGDREEQFSASPLDSITNSTRSTTYLSLASPALSASSFFPSSEHGYENDSSPSEISSTFSSPSVPPTRLGQIGLESLPPHDQAHLSHSVSHLSSRSSPSSNDNHLLLQSHRRQQQAGWAPMRVSVPAFSAPTTRSDAGRSMTTFSVNECDDYGDTQTLNQRSSTTRSPWMTGSLATTLITTEIHPLEPAARKSRTMSDFDVDSGSELSDLDFLNISAEESAAFASAAAVAGGSVDLGRSVVYTGGDGENGVGRAAGIGMPGIRRPGMGKGDRSESDISSWSLAGGSE